MSKATVESLPLTIVDGFAGGGRYNNTIAGTEVKGSPFLILEAVKEQKSVPMSTAENREL